MSEDGRSGAEAIRVLVVHGVARESREMVATLCSAGFAAAAASDAFAALRVMDERGAPDVLVTDLRTDGLSGVELLGIARTRWPAIVVVLVTEADTPKPTPDDVLLRVAPLRGPELVSAVEEALRWRGARGE